MNIANIMTVSRVFFVPIILALIWTHSPLRAVIATVLVLIGGITDLLDGYLARRQGLVSDAGKLLDPIADKLLVLCVLVYLTHLDRAPVIVAILLIAREVVVTGVRSVAAGEGLIISAGQMGKYKTWFQMWALGALIMHDEYYGFNAHYIGVVLLWVSLYFSLSSGFEYVWNYYKTRAKGS